MVIFSREAKPLAQSWILPIKFDTLVISVYCLPKVWRLVEKHQSFNMYLTPNCASMEKMLPLPYHALFLTCVAVILSPNINGEWFALKSKHGRCHNYFEKSGKAECTIWRSKEMSGFKGRKWVTFNFASKKMWNFDPENVWYSQICSKQTPGGCSIPVNNDNEMFNACTKILLSKFFLFFFWCSQMSYAKNNATVERLNRSSPLKQIPSTSTSVCSKAQEWNWRSKIFL